MNITNSDALDAMVSIGRQALERGKVDQALTILSGVLSKAPNHPLAWFSLGRAHLLKGAHDHAAMCYHRAAALARTARGVPANLPRLARDNMVLCGDKVLPAAWLPAMQDPYHAEKWGAALQSLAAALTQLPYTTTAPEQTVGGNGSNNDNRRQVYVAGGIGLQALALHGLLTAGTQAAATPAAAGT
ncbi:hypothetical protein Agub_g6618, partial [Astrephomene gubernaculifera]